MTDIEDEVTELKAAVAVMRKYASSYGTIPRYEAAGHGKIMQQIVINAVNHCARDIETAERSNLYKLAMYYRILEYYGMRDYEDID